MSDILEIARFKFVDGANAAQSAGAIDAWLAAQPGFVSRVMVGPDADGYYTDLVRWQGAEPAQQAMAAMAQSVEAADFMRVVDPSSVQMSHVPVLVG